MKTNPEPLWKQRGRMLADLLWWAACTELGAIACATIFIVAGCWVYLKLFVGDIH